MTGRLIGLKAKRPQSSGGYLSWKNRVILISLYLGATIAANLTVAWLGPVASIPTAFMFIGLDLTSRDKLHDVWKGKQLAVKMALLIVAGSGISYVLNAQAGRIGVASCIAFFAAGAVDAATYHLLGEKPRWVRVNGSNVLSAAVDSVVFPTLAFGAILPGVMVGQWVAKVVGGAIWYKILVRGRAAAFLQIAK